MADFKLSYTGQEVNETIRDGKKIMEIYNALQSHLQGHVTNEARGILVADNGAVFRASNVEDILRQMENEYNNYIKNSNSVFDALEKQITISSSEIDTVIANALR